VRNVLVGGATFVVVQHARRHVAAALPEHTLQRRGAPAAQCDIVYRTAPFTSAKPPNAVHVIAMSSDFNPSPVVANRRYVAKPATVALVVTRTSPAPSPTSTVKRVASTTIRCHAIGY